MRLGRLPLLAAMALAFAAFLAVGLAGARPALAADPTMAPFEAGRHVYDYGDVLSKKSAALAETYATQIESMGGGRVVVYTVVDSNDMPSSSDFTGWQVDGMLFTAEKDSSGQLVEGAKFKDRLTHSQQDSIDTSERAATLESWIMTSLARVDAFLGNKHIFDGAGVFDAAGLARAETAATDLASKIGGNVYVDISIGGDDPSSTAFFNGADLSSSLDHSLVIALSVTGSRYGGFLDSSSELWDSWTGQSPWSGTEIKDQTIPNGDVAGSIQTAIGSVKNGSSFNTDMTGEILPWIVFAIVIVIFSITAPFLWGPWLIRKLTGTSGPIKGGLPTSATIQSITDTGTTVSMPSVGPDAPEYKLGLIVTPPGGASTPYAVMIKALVPRIFVPMVVPGATIGVLVDPTDPTKVVPDWQNFNNPGGSQSAALAGLAQAFGAAGAAGTASMLGASEAAGTPSGVPTMDLTFDAAGNPNMAQLGAFAGAVNSGSMPTHSGSAAQLLATGTHGTAVITTAMPLGKTVRQVNPGADPSTLDDPLWIFTVEVSLAGQAPFPAVFGHRVPKEKAASIGPGTRLAVAVNPVNRNQEVAIDWNQSPMIS